MPVLRSRWAVRRMRWTVGVQLFLLCAVLALAFVIGAAARFLFVR